MADNASRDGDLKLEIKYIVLTWILVLHTFITMIYQNLIK